MNCQQKQTKMGLDSLFEELRVFKECRWPCGVADPPNLGGEDSLLKSEGGPQNNTVKQGVSDTPPPEFGWWICHPWVLGLGVFQGKWIQAGTMGVVCADAAAKPASDLAADRIPDAHGLLDQEACRQGYLSWLMAPQKFLPYENTYPHSKHITYILEDPNPLKLRSLDAKPYPP